MKQILSTKCTRKMPIAKLALIVKSNGKFQKAILVIFISLMLISSSTSIVFAQCEKFSAIIAAYGRARRSAGIKSSRSLSKRRIKDKSVIKERVEVVKDSPDVVLPCNSRMFDQFGSIAGCDMRSRLDNFAIQLQSEPGAMGFIVAYSVPTSGRNYGLKLADEARNYMVNQRGIDSSRIAIVDGGARNNLTIQLWVTR